MALTGSRSGATWFCPTTCHRKKTSKHRIACPLCCGYRETVADLKVRSVPRGQRVLAVIGAYGVNP